MLSNRPFTRRACCLAAFWIFAGASVGCEKPDWTNPAYLSQQIESGDRLKALDELSKLDEAKQREVIPALINAYNNKQDQERVLDILVALRDPKALNVYVDALRNAPSNRMKAKAATALGDLKAVDQIGTLLDSFRNVPNEDLRRAILEAFVKMPDPQSFPLLVEILTKYDPDRDPIAYHSYACDVLAHSDQLTDTVIPSTVYGMFLDNAKAQNVYKECAAAVFNAGFRATPELQRVVKGEHAELKQRFERYSSYVEGSNEIKAVDAMGLMHDPAAVDFLIEQIQTKREAPATYRDQKLLTWGQNRIQFFVYAVGALSDTGGGAKVVEALVPFLTPDVAPAKGKPAPIEPFKAMVDYDKRSKHDILLAAIDGLNANGDRSALPALELAARNGNIPELERYGNPEFVYQSRWEAARAFARLGTGADLEKFDKLIADEKVEGAKKKFQEFRPMLEIAQECKDQAACYGRYLKEGKGPKAEKAAWELGRIAGSEDALLEGLNTPDLEVRKVVMLGLYRVGTAKGVAKIDEVLQAEVNERSDQHKDTHFKMRALRAFLKNKKG
jgi:hypothetical protein